MKIACYFFIISIFLYTSCETVEQTPVDMFFSKIITNIDGRLIEEYKNLPKDSNDHAFDKIFFGHSDTLGYRSIVFYLDSLNIPEDPNIRLKVLNNIFYDWIENYTAGAVGEN